MASDGAGTIHPCLYFHGLALLQRLQIYKQVLANNPRVVVNVVNAFSRAGDRATDLLLSPSSSIPQFIYQVNLLFLPVNLNPPRSAVFLVIENMICKTVQTIRKIQVSGTMGFLL